MSGRLETEDQIAAREKKAASRAVALVWLGVFFVSTASLFVRASSAPSLVLAAYRKLFAALLLLPAALGNAEYRRELRSLDLKSGALCALSGVFLAFHFWTYFLSVNNTTVTASQVLVGTEVLFVALVMFLTGRERYGLWSGLGIALALAGGVLTAYVPGGLQSGGGTLFGNLCGVVSAMALAGYSLIGTRVRHGMSNTVYTLLVYGTSAAILCVMIAFSPYHFTGYGPVNYLTAFLMAVFNSLLGHSIFNWSLKYLSPTLVSVIKLFQPVLATTWAFFLLREAPSLNQLLGGAVAILGILLYIRRRDAARKAAS